MNTDLESLVDYFHDATLHWAKYEPRKTSRRLEIAIDCHPDAGCDLIDGKRVIVRFEKLAFINFVCFGWQHGPEEIDGWNWTVSNQMKAEFSRLTQPPIVYKEFSIFCHTGSFIEGICKSIEFEIIETD